MRHRVAFAGVLSALLLGSAAESLACGDKFLVAGRGTRYQRPKNFRAASVVIYADPASGLPSAVGKLPVEAVLKREGHRSTTVATLDQLAALLAGGRFDVVLAAGSVVEAVKGLLGGGADAPVVVAFCAKGGQEGKGGPCVKSPPKEGSLLQAIDSAVARHDENVRKAKATG